MVLCQRQQPIPVKIRTLEDVFQPLGKAAVGVVATTSEDQVELWTEVGGVFTCRSSAPGWCGFGKVLVAMPACDPRTGRFPLAKLPHSTSVFVYLQYSDSSQYSTRHDGDLGSSSIVSRGHASSRVLASRRYPATQ